MAILAELACMVAKDNTPVEAVLIAKSAISTSRISPNETTSGFCLAADLINSENSDLLSSCLISTWLIPLSSISTGSSIEMMVLFNFLF